MDELERNNYAELCGTLAAPPALSHENRQERFFTFPLQTQPRERCRARAAAGRDAVGGTGTAVRYR